MFAGSINSWLLPFTWRGAYLRVSETKDVIRLGSTVIAGAKVLAIHGGAQRRFLCNRCFFSASLRELGHHDRLKFEERFRC